MSRHIRLKGVESRDSWLAKSIENHHQISPHR